jgi:RimJ/RimL family protein N-acetyltransferase
MRNVFLAGTRVYLRPLEREDTAHFVAWVNDPQVTRTLLLHRPMTLEAEEEFLANITKSERDVVLGIVARVSDDLIGITGLHQIDGKDRHAVFGIFIGEVSEWGKGYGTEATRLMVEYAFDTLNLHRVWLHVLEHHAAAIRLYRKVGFQQEGVLREALFREGRYHNLITMAILRDEWRARQGADADSPARTPTSKTDGGRKQGLIRSFLARIH